MLLQRFSMHFSYSMRRVLRLAYHLPGQSIQCDHDCRSLLNELGYSFLELGQVRFHGVHLEQILRERLHLFIQVVNIDTFLLSHAGHGRLGALLSVLPRTSILRLPLTAILTSFDHL